MLCGKGMKIFKQTIANRHEWQPCIHCGRRFAVGEIITAIENDTGSRVDYWYCSECFEAYWFSPLPPPVPAEDYDFCLVEIGVGKVRYCPKPMKPAEYMKREICFRSTYPEIEIRKSAMY